MKNVNIDVYCRQQLNIQSATDNEGSMALAGVAREWASKNDNDQVGKRRQIDNIEGLYYNAELYFWD